MQFDKENEIGRANRALVGSVLMLASVWVNVSPKDDQLKWLNDFSKYLSIAGLGFSIWRVVNKYRTNPDNAN